MPKQKNRYHRRPDGLLEATRTDPRTRKRIHFYGHSDREIDKQIMAFSSARERGRSFEDVAKEWWESHFPTLAVNTRRGYKASYNHAITEFGAEPISQIKPQDIQRNWLYFLRQWREVSAHPRRVQCQVEGIRTGDWNNLYSPPAPAQPCHYAF